MKPANIPAETPCFRSTAVSAVRYAPDPVIETSLRNSSQERNFLLQRPGGETGSFGSIAGAETALTRVFGRHVFEIAALLRVSQRLYNYRVWMVGATGIEPVTPSMSTRCSPAELRAPKRVVVTGWVRISAPKQAGKEAWGENQA